MSSTIASVLTLGKRNEICQSAVRHGRMHSFVSSLHHCVFATKRREPVLTPAIRERLWPYLGGIARENGMKTLVIGGVADHVHVLLSLPATCPYRRRCNFSKAIHRNGFMKRFPRFGVSRGTPCSNDGVLSSLTGLGIEDSAWTDPSAKALGYRQDR
jgi:REP element-mobilizing transposase RayT